MLESSRYMGSHTAEPDQATLDALKEYHRDFLEDLIEDAIREHIDLEAKQAVEQRVANHQETLADAVDVDRSVVE